MTYTEAAAFLGLSVEQVRRRIWWGQLRRVGGQRHTHVLRVDVEALRTSVRAAVRSAERAG